MTFNPAIPNPTDYLSASQPTLKANNTALDNVFFVNHYRFSDASSNAGKHRFIEIVNGSKPAGASGESLFYSRKVGSKACLFYSNDNTGNEYQMTTPSDSGFAKFAKQTGTNREGWSFLPGNMVIQYGQIDNPGGSGTETYAIPFDSAVFAIVFTARIDDGSSHSAFTYWLDGAPGLTSFKYRGSVSSLVDKLHYIAVGI